MNMEQCLTYMQENCLRGKPGGLLRTKRMAELLGNPQEGLQVIHVAGTNGKGSVCAIIAAVLQAADYQVGLFTSPHLEDYRERIQLNGQLISAENFAHCLTMLIEQVIPRLLAEGYSHPGEFELLTMAAFLYFLGRTDFVVLEVGLGGELDPTNIITRPLVAVITPISLDHCQVLGGMLTEIAQAKAGIIKRQSQVVCAPQTEAVLAVIRQKCMEQEANWLVLDAVQQPQYTLALSGDYQQSNCHLALAALDTLREQGVAVVTGQHIEQGLQQVCWPGRMEYISLPGQRAVLLDGAHNPAGIMALANELRKHYWQREIILLLGILDDKEQQMMLEQIAPLAQKIIITRVGNEQRSEQWQRLLDYASGYEKAIAVQAIASPEEAVRSAIARLAPGQLLCITGSLHLLGECRRVLRQLFF